MVDTTLKLKSWEDFKAAMAEHMKQFDEKWQEHILIALYHRADQLRMFETLRSKEKTQVPLLRRDRIQVQRKRSHIENAIESLQKAKTMGGQQTLAGDYITEAESALRRAVADLLVVEDSLAAAVHPAFRNKREKMTTRQSPRAEGWRFFPGFGIAQIDQMFFGWMEDYLQYLVTRGGSRLSSAQINKIISATLDAALGASYSEERVKTARLRLAKLRLLGSNQKP